MRFILTLIGVSVAFQYSTDLPPLKPRHEYVFRFEGDVHSGVPISSDSSVTRIQAMVHVQTVDDRAALLKMKNIRLANGEGDHKDFFKSIDDMKMRTISEEHLELLKMPVRFVYKNGMVGELQFAENEETWSANMKRSMINMLQINLQKIGRVEGANVDGQMLARDNDFFTVNERTIEGDCEVAYTIVKKKDFVTEVTKSVNFNKCSRRPQAKYNFRYLSKCPDCEEDDIFEQSTVYTYLIEENGLKKVEAASVYTVNIESQPVMKSEIRTKLNLEDIKEIGQDFEAFNGKTESLVYSNDFEKQIERFYMYGDDADMLPYQHVKEKTEAIQNVVDEFRMQKENNKETTNLLTRLVSMLRMCSLNELKTVHSKIYMNGDERLKVMIENSLAIAGTKNTITHLLRHLEKQHTKTYRIFNVLKSIQESPYPSPGVVDELLRFSNTNIVKRSPVIHQTIWLAVGSVIRGVVADSMDEFLTMDNQRGLKQKYLNILWKQFEKSDEIYDKVLALKSLANAGIDLSVHELEKVILNKNEKMPVRMEAIDALRLFKDSMPRKINSILIPIYKSRVEPPELRMAALVRIMHTLPRQPIVAQIISTMERDPNQQVAAFTYNMLNSFAGSTHTCYKKIANDIRPLLAISRYQPSGRVFTSTYKFWPLFNENLMSGINVEFATIFGKNSIWPKEMMLSLDSVFSGMWNKNLVQLGFSQQNIEQFVTKLTRKLMKMEQNTQSMSRARRIKESLTLLKDLAKKLNIHPRVSGYNNPYAMLYFRYKEMDYAVLPLDDKAIDDMLEKYIREGKIDKKELVNLFNSEPEFQLHIASFLYENIRKIPTILGLPLKMKDMQPTVGSAVGEFKFDKVPSGLRLRLNTQPSFASTQVSEMKLWSPIFEQGVKVARSAEAHLPINFEAEVLYKDEFELKYTINVPKNEKTLLRVWSHPTTFFRFLCGQSYFAEVEQKTVVIPKWRGPIEEKEKVLNIWGIKAVLRGNFFNQWNKRNVLLGDNDWEFVLNPSYDSPKKILFYLNTGKPEKVRLDKIDSSYLFDKTFDLESTKYERYDERERRDYINKFARNIERSEGYKYRFSIRVEAVDSSVERYGTAEIVTICDHKFNYCKMIAKGKRSQFGDERRDWEFTTNMQLLLPEMPKSLNELKTQVHREIQGLIQSKWGADEMNEVNAKFQLEQSKEQKEWMKLANKQYKGVTAYEIFHQASVLNQLKVVIDYDLTPSMKDFVQRIYDYFKGYTFWYSKVSANNGEPKKVFLKVSVDPVSRSLVNALLETPYERVEVKDIVVPRLYLPSIAKRSLRDFRDEFVKEQVCEIKSNKIRTFDGLTFRAPITNCYSVIAKDCSEEPRFAVLLKKLVKNGEEKELKIIDEREQVVKVKMVRGKLSVFVDNEEINKGSMERYNIKMVEDNMVLVKLEDLEIRFDGYDTKVYMGKQMSEKQCGLCGHFDEDKDNDFYTSKNEYTSDIEEFHKSYLLMDKCEVDKDFRFEKKDYAIEKDVRSDDNWMNIFDYESSNNDSKDYSEEMPENTHVMEFSHRVCFSLEPVRKCRKNEQVEDVVQKKVRFTCLPRSSYQTSQLLQKANTEVLDLEGYPVSFVENLQVPRSCVVY